MQHIWQFRGDAQASLQFDEDVLEAAEGSPLLARLLSNRGIKTPEAIRRFLNLADYQPTSGLELPDMPQAVERILKAIQTNEHILIYGDFDVDGITGTSI
ncbi:MAG TPA: hypothetical protein V6C99_05045, partial [Oculatellaceae cyanobacterium]